MTASWTDKYDPRFVRAVQRVLKHEGFFSDDPDDPGGATKYGISLRWLRTKGLFGDFDGDGDVDRDDIWAMEIGEAVAAYHRFWWEQEGYGNLDLYIAGKVFDLAVNMGARSAHRIVQRAVRAAGGPTLVVDGILGEKSRSAIRGRAGPALLAATRAEAAGHYRGLIIARPVFKKFEGGWLNRAYT